MAITTDSQSLTGRLSSLKSTIETGRTERARAEATLESLQKQEAEIHGELAEMGVTPENLDAEVKELRDRVDKGLNEAEKLLRGE